MFLRYSLTRGRAVNAIARIGMALSLSNSIERPRANSLEQTGDAGRFHFEGL